MTPPFQSSYPAVPLETTLNDQDVDRCFKCQGLRPDHKSWCSYRGRDAEVDHVAFMD